MASYHSQALTECARKGRLEGMCTVDLKTKEFAGTVVVVKNIQESMIFRKPKHR